MKKIFLCSVLVLMAFLVGCISAPKYTITDAPVAGYKTYNNNEAGISFQFPNSWSLSEKKDTFVYLNGPYSSFAVLLTSVPASTYGSMAYEDINAEKKKPESFNIDQKAVLVGGAVAKMNIVDHGPQGKDSALKDTTTISTIYVSDDLNDRVVIMIMGTPSSNYEQSSNNLDRILQTFVWTKLK